MVPLRCRTFEIEAQTLWAGQIMAPCWQTFSHTIVPEQFDADVWFDEAQSVTPRGPDLHRRLRCSPLRARCDAKPAKSRRCYPQENHGGGRAGPVPFRKARKHHGFRPCWREGDRHHHHSRCPRPADVRATTVSGDNGQTAGNCYRFMLDDRKGNAAGDSDLPEVSRGHRARQTLIAVERREAFCH